MQVLSNSCGIKLCHKKSVFSWRIIINRLQTNNNLLRRNIIGPRVDMRCALFGDCLKIDIHLFFWRRVLYWVRMLCYNWVGIQFVFPNDVVGHLQQHIGWIKGKWRKKIWLAIWLSTWTILEYKQKYSYLGNGSKVDWMVLYFSIWLDNKDTLVFIFE